MKFKSIAVLALVALMISPALGDDDAKEKKAKKGAKGEKRSIATALIKQLEPVGLTEDQIAKIKELAAKSQASMKEAREKAGITPEIQKKLAAAQKSMKDSELKGKERMAAIHKAAGLTEDQAAAIAKANSGRAQFKTSVVALLTDAQKEKLPAAFKRGAGNKKGGAKKGDGKKGDAKKGAKKKKDAA